MSKSTFKILFYIRKNQVNKDGTVCIMVRLTVSGDVTQFSSKLNVDPKAWDVRLGKVAGNSVKARQLNDLLEDIRTSLKNHYRDIEVHESFVTAEKVRNAFLGFTAKQRTLLELFKKHNEDAQKLVGISKTPATMAKYDRCYRRIEEFMKAKYNITDIALKEINHMFITDFETYLRTVSLCNENTTAKFMQTFRMIVIMAKNNGWIYTDPFMNYKIRLKRVDRGYLTEQEIQKILKKKFPTKRLEQVRDVFIFSCFTGLSYIDIKTLKVPLLKIPLAILKKYDGQLPKGELLPVLSNQKLNSYLKEIADLCGINKNITFHMSRHTFATMCLNNGVKMENVSKMLGHTNVRTTQQYAKVLNAEVEKDFEMLERILS